MSNTIVLGGKERPFSVGVNQGDIYCSLAKITLAEYATTFGNISTLGLGAQRDFLYSALRAGAERLGQPFTLTNLEIGDLMDMPDFELGSALSPIIKALAKQFEAKANFQKEREAKNAVAPTPEPISSN